MITLKDLQKFCSFANCGRATALGRPFRKDGLTYASDGRIIVRCKKPEAKENSHAPSGVTQLPWNIENPEWRPIPELPEAELVECDECFYEEPIYKKRCGRCAGSGKRDEHIRIRIGNQDVEAHYLRMIRALPEAMIDYGFKAVNGVAVSFKFKGGEGLLMPMKPEPNLMKGNK